MTGRIRKVGIVLTAVGLMFVAATAFAAFKTYEGYRALNTLSAAQAVTLTYNDQGQLTDRGKTDEAQAIMSLLTNDWGYPVNSADLNPNDPTVNTASEYMYQMATITYHTLHSTVAVTLAEPVDYKGKHYAAGEYQVPIAGKYFSQMDRLDPLEGPARNIAWSGTAHALIAELGVGTATATALQLGLGIAGLFAGLALIAFIAGLGIVWATQPERETNRKASLQPQVIPV